MRRSKPNRRNSAKAFKARATKTAKVNTMTPQRGGWRL